MNPSYCNQEAASLYPKASSCVSPPTANIVNAPADTPTSDSPSSSGSLPSTYEVLVELQASLTEGPPVNLSPSAMPVHPILSAPVSGTMRVIQGPRLDSAPSPAGYHAFLSLGTLNVPLLPTHPASRLCHSPAIFEIRIPHRRFVIRVQEGVEVELIDSLQGILQWFCGWSTGDDAVNVAGGVASSGEGPGALPPTPAPTPSASQDRFARAGDRGVDFVERMGSRLNNSIQRRLSARVEQARESEPRQVKLGGSVTGKVLGGARVVVGKGASIASVVTDKLSGAVGKGLAKNPVTKSFSEAPDGSGRKKFHDNLMAGTLAFGRVYVAADKQGKIILQNSGDGAAEYAGATYGEEARQAARSLGGIVLDGYRISRFPQKLGATSLVKGALKSTAQTNDVGDGGAGVLGEGTPGPVHGPKPAVEKS